MLIKYILADEQVVALVVVVHDVLAQEGTIVFVEVELVEDSLAAGDGVLLFVHSNINIKNRN